jgi:transcriptional regulator with XRE-family HTH domain
MLDPNTISRRLRELREGRNLSLRALALKAGVAVSFLSKVERGRGSPTVATLLKILKALGTSAPAFFAEPSHALGNVLIQRKAGMKVLDDGDKSWRYLFPNTPGVQAVMTHEQYQPRTRHVEVEQHAADICGLVLSGVLTLLLPGQDAVTVRAGDSFYIRAGTRHASANRGATLLRMVVAELSHTRVTDVRSKRSATRRHAGNTR